MKEKKSNSKISEVGEETKEISQEKEVKAKRGGAKKKGTTNKKAKQATSKNDEEEDDLEEAETKVETTLQPTPKKKSKDLGMLDEMKAAEILKEVKTKTVVS